MFNLELWTRVFPFKQPNPYQPDLFKIMSFPAWQQHLDALCYPCLVILCQSMQHRSGPCSENHRSWPMQLRPPEIPVGMGCPSTSHRRVTMANNPGTRPRYNTKCLNVFSSPSLPPTLPCESDTPQQCGRPACSFLKPLEDQEKGFAIHRG